MTTGQELFADMVRAKIRREDQLAEIARLREALTPSADTKAAYMGEFQFGAR